MSKARIRRGHVLCSNASRSGSRFSIVASVVLDVLIAALFVLASRYKPAVAAVALLPGLAEQGHHLVERTGPGGGGGGGGNKMKEPPRKAELPGKDKITVPVEKPPKLEPPQQVKNEPNPIEQLNIPAKELAAAQDSLPGAIEAPPGPPTVSQGSGSGGGAGTGPGPESVQAPARVSDREAAAEPAAEPIGRAMA